MFPAIAIQGEIMASAKKALSATARSNKVKTKHANMGGAVHPQGPKPSIADGAVVMDRRTSGERRKGGERRKANVPVDVERRQLERRGKVNRRRQIDPTTCERNYTPEEIEFMKALEAYKRSSGRMFPTCSEILEVLRSLGYEKRAVMEPEATGSVCETVVPGPVTPAREHGIPA